jgi:Na+/glutamate symporter
LPGQVFSKSFCQGASELGVRPGRLGFLAGEVIGLPVFRYIRQNDGKNTVFRGGNDVSNFLDDPDF